MIQLDLSDHRPLYEQIKEKFKHLIITGALEENDKIPSVRELSAMLTINPNTIQHAYKELEAEGYIYSQKARGNFVSPIERLQSTADVEEILENISSLVKNAKFLGVSEEEIINTIKKCYNE